ncbi:TetR/AcrR family transcriptional regulator [Sphingopyxis sp. PET50]|uniref:TetR/AcrR family transcriptional regulator n=1 Tax=Sphingopyxis sp. PET50 TaxID=2976533 RepID=UPI0021B06ADF|nr:TetR/AcrR family transcriptional regulator [Sphingopyxis sp. PET50]
MANKDNSVNIKSDGAKAAGAYHHGDLRAAVIAAGLKRLESGDGGELGLRALARDVGVSATALYRHFPDKEALLDALADEGLRAARRAAGAGVAEGGRRVGGVQGDGHRLCPLRARRARAVPVELHAPDARTLPRTGQRRRRSCL